MSKDQEEQENFSKEDVSKIIQGCIIVTLTTTIDYLKEHMIIRSKMTGVPLDTVLFDIDDTSNPTELINKYIIPELDKVGIKIGVNIEKLK